MKNDKMMKAKTKIPTLKTAVAAPAAKAPEASPVRQPSAKVTAAKAPVAPAAPVVKSETAPIVAPTVVAQVPQRPVVAPQAEPQAPQRREITSDVIALRAYNLWEQQGRPPGREMANWLLAESQLKQEIQSFTA
jgi:H+-transporting ATPase